MRIAFVDFFGMSYDPCTVDTAPLGGTESAASYLTRALARQGHEIYLAGRNKRDGFFDGVRCTSRLDDGAVPWEQLDAAICMGSCDNVTALRNSLGPKSRLVLWLGHPANQPAVQFLHDAAQRDAYDGIAMVSQWQLDDYHRNFGIDRTRMAVLRNAAGFSFERQFSGGEAILPHKTRPPVLAYTSVPYRGLNVLLDSFPLIRAAMPETRLKIFSSTTLYQISADQDRKDYGDLYRRCMDTEGCEYIGALPQRQLSLSLREVAVLTYPNTFAETSCIGVMEALASGCRVVTTDFGGLRETCAGFACLIPPWPTRQQYLNDFVGQAVQVLREAVERPSETEQLLRRQVDYMNQYVTWSSRAGDWVRWLAALPGRTW